MGKRIKKSEMWAIVRDASFQAGRTRHPKTYNEAMAIMCQALVAIGIRKPEESVPIAFPDDWCKFCGSKIR